MSRLFALSSIPAWLAIAACAAAPPRQDPIQLLSGAEGRLNAGDLPGAITALDQIDDSQLKGEYLERAQIARARYLELSGSPFAAFKVLREFVKAHPFSHRMPEVRTLVFRIGETLLASNGGFLFFTSDKDDGITVYEFFYTHFPEDRERMPAVLVALGEQAWQSEEWPLALERYEAIKREFNDPSNEWLGLARFRAAMCHYRALQGSDYDREALALAERELESYMRETTPDNAQHDRAAHDALRQVRTWTAEKELRTARFYRTVRKPPGYRLHLERAATYTDTEPGREARDLLAEMRTGGAASQPASRGARP